MVVGNRIACVHLHALLLEPLLEGPPKLSAVRSEIRGRRVLVAVSEAARAHRIHEGMTETEARARAPKLEVREHDPAKDFTRLCAAAELLLAFGPVVEVCPPSFLMVEIGRSKSALAKKLANADEQTIGAAIVRTLAKFGHQSRVVVAKDPDTGRSILEHLDRAAKKAPKKTRARSEVVIVPAGEERRLLARLPVSALLWTDLRGDPEGKKREALLSAHASLSMLGIDVVARLQTLPPAQVGSRFGDAGALLMQRAKAERDRPLEAFIPPERLVAEIELDRETDDLEPILFLLKRLFDQLEARLDARALSATALDLTFLVEPGLEHEIEDRELRAASSKKVERIPIRFARATRRAGTMLKIAKEKLAGALPGKVRAIRVEASSPEKDRGAQLDLFTSSARRVEEVGELVGRLIAALGEQSVFSPENPGHAPPRARLGSPPVRDRARVPRVAGPPSQAGALGRRTGPARRCGAGVASLAPEAHGRVQSDGTYGRDGHPVCASWLAVAEARPTQAGGRARPGASTAPARAPRHARARLDRARIPRRRAPLARTASPFGVRQRYGAPRV